MRESTDATDLGEIVHAMVLGTGSKFTVADCSDFTAPKTGKPYETWSGAAKDWRDEQREKGMIVIGRDTNAMAMQISAKLTNALRERFGAAAWDTSAREQTVIAKRRLNDGTEIWCRIRIDALLRAAIVDVKTTALSLSDIPLGKEMALKGLDVQACFYQDVFGAATNGLTHPFIFAYQQTVPPYATRLVNLDEPELNWPLSITRLEIDMAAHKFGAALKSGTWSGDPIDAKPVYPEWLKNQKAFRLMEMGLLEDSE